MIYKTISIKSLIVGALAAASALFVAGVIIGTAGKSEAVSASGRLIPIYSVNTDEKKIALTFDAAWGAEDTQQIIDILGKYNAKATFFVTGEWARRNPKCVSELYSAGNEIGCHSDNHTLYSKLTRSEIISDINACADSIEKTGIPRPLLTRAPSGDYTNDAIEAADSLKMKTIQWSVDSLDWKGLSADEIVKRVVSKTIPGSILLFHNDVKNTPAALDEALSILFENGYSFVTVSSLVYSDNYRIDESGKQISTN